MSKLKFLIKNIRNFRTLQQFDDYLWELFKDITETVTPSPLELEAFYEEVRSRKNLNGQFFLVMSTIDNGIHFHWNTERYFNSSDLKSDLSFLEMIHPDYLTDYLQWGIAGYAFVLENKHIIEPFKHIFRMIYPIRLKNNQYYWVQMEIFVLGLDKNGNVTYHFNTYTILSKPFFEKEKSAIIVDVSIEGLRDEDLTKELKKWRFTKQPFVLTKSQRQVLYIKRKQPNLTNAAIAALLNKDKETVDTQNKQILAKAKESFPSYFDTTEKRTVTDVIEFLEELSYFRYTEW
ncbi:MAG: hypothetical protein JNL70_07070 [Saprospiraceae bacterium]|nr:hypothetical protein [Saprospiraceae bacterium]